MTYFVFCVVFAIVVLFLIKNNFYKLKFNNKYYTIHTSTETFQCARFYSDDEELVITPYKINKEDLFYYVANGAFDYAMYIYRWDDLKKLETEKTLYIKKGSNKLYREYCDDSFNSYIENVYLPSI